MIETAQDLNKMRGLCLDLAPKERLYIIDIRTGEAIKISGSYRQKQYVYYLAISASDNYHIFRERVIRRYVPDYEPILKKMNDGEPLTQEMLLKLKNLRK